MKILSALQLDDKTFATWKEVLRNVSETVSNDTDIVTSDIALLVIDERIYYLSSEGSTCCSEPSAMPDTNDRRY